MDKDKLIKIHNLLMGISVSGDSVEKLYIALVELTNVINSLNEDATEVETDE